jgi:hypothetical protein
VTSLYLRLNLMYCPLIVVVVVLSTMVANLFELISRVYTRSTFPLSSNYRAMVKKEGNTSRNLIFNSIYVYTLSI